MRKKEQVKEDRMTEFLTRIEELKNGKPQLSKLENGIESV